MLHDPRPELKGDGVEDKLAKLKSQMGEKKAENENGENNVEFVTGVTGPEEGNDIIYEENYFDKAENYYEDNEWHCGKIPMKNWKNAVYAWNKNQKRWSDEKAQKAAEAKTKNSFQQNTYDFEQLEKDLVKN